jgi:hypothetical protein
MNDKRYYRMQFASANRTYTWKSSIVNTTAIGLMAMAAEGCSLK